MTVEELCRCNRKWNADTWLTVKVIGKRDVSYSLENPRKVIEHFLANRNVERFDDFTIWITELE